MDRRKKLVLIGFPLLLSAFACAAPVFAQATADMDDPPAANASADGAEHARHPRHDPVAFAQHRLDKLKSQLGITADQQAQWTVFSDKVLAQMEQVKAAHQAMRNVPATAPERIDREVARMKQRTAGFEGVAQAAGP